MENATEPFRNTSVLLNLQAAILPAGLLAIPAIVLARAVASGVAISEVNSF